MSLEVLEIGSPPHPNSPGVLGCGESLLYGKGFYHYRVGQHCPKDRAISLVQESGYCGRQKGDLDYIVAAWDGSNFVLLDHVYSDIRKFMQQFKGLTNLEAIDLIKKRNAERQAVLDSYPRCIHCGGMALVMLEDQPADTCCECFEKGQK